MDTKSPKISVVTISFNQANFLGECIESVRAQDYPNYEHIVVDAASTDGSVEVLRASESLNLQWTSEPDAGPADGLNRGFSRATGDIYYYLNADDVLLPGAFRRIVELFDRHPKVDVIYGDGLELNEAGGITRTLFSSTWGIAQFTYGSCSVVQQSTFFRRNAYLRTNGFNLQNRFNWDAELLVDMAMAGCQFRYVSERFGGFRMHKESLSGSRRWAEQSRVERRRLAEKALGRTLTSKDDLKVKAYRLEKWFRNPKASLAKALTFLASRPSY